MTSETDHSIVITTLPDNQDPDFDAARKHLQEQSEHGALSEIQSASLDELIDFINRLEDNYEPDRFGLFSTDPLYDEDGSDYPQKTAKYQRLLAEMGAFDAMKPETDEYEQGDLFDE